MRTSLRTVLTLSLVAAAILATACIAVEKSATPDTGNASARAHEAQSVRFNTQPMQAEVYVDGKFVGTTPLRYPLTPGDHQIELKANGYQSWARTLHVVAGGDSNVSVNLVPATD